MPLTAHMQPAASLPNASRPERILPPTPIPDKQAWPMFAGLGPLGALPPAPRLARRFTTMILASWGLPAAGGNPDVVDTAELIASELVSNVVRAAADPDGNPRYDSDGRLPVLWLRLLAGPSPGAKALAESGAGARDLAGACATGRVQIEVWDDLPAGFGVPAPRAATQDDESGRGLALVCELSDDCGWAPVPGHDAKRVWVLLTA